MRASHRGRVFDDTMGDVNRQTFGLALLALFAVSGCADSTAVTAPTTVALASVVLSSSSVSGGTPLTGILTLTGLAPAGGAIVTIASSSAAVAVPASVTIPEGSQQPVLRESPRRRWRLDDDYRDRLLRARVKRRRSPRRSLTPPALQSVFSLSAAVSIAGVPVQGTITLTAAAPAGGLTVALTSSSPLATVPGDDCSAIRQQPFRRLRLDNRPHQQRPAPRRSRRPAPASPAPRR